MSRYPITRHAITASTTAPATSAHSLHQTRRIASPSVAETIARHAQPR